ncbi:MAG: recombinase family protein [Pedobacter sp.]|jgi:DNA invertase Pin-like site-specific DNA recombinase
MSTNNSTVPAEFTKTAVIYCRVSDPGQVSGFSLDVQRELCEKWALENQHKVVGIFTDGGKSGTKTVGRQALEDLLIRCQEEHIDTMLVIDTDRLAREEKDHFIIKAALKKFGTRLVAVNQPMIDDSPEGQLFETLLAAINAFYSRLLGRKVRKSLEKKFWDGNWPGWAPLGYKNYNIGTEDKPNRIVIVDEEKAQFVTELFNLYSTGQYTLDKLADSMYLEGFRSKNGGKVYRSVIHSMLRNPFYIGELHYREMINPNGQHQPLTTRAIFNTCQRMLEVHNRFACRKRRYRWLYNGMVFCGTCGSRMYAEFQHKKRHAYYHCNTRKHCREPFVELNDLHDKVAEEFHKIQLPKRFVNRVMSKAQELVSQTKGNADSQKVALENAILQLKNKKAKLLEVLLNQTIDNNTFQDKDADFNIQIKALEDRMSDIEANNLIDYNLVENVMSLASNIYYTYTHSNFDAKRLYLKLFFEKFTIQGRNIVEAEPSPLFKALLDTNCRVTPNWLHLIESERTYFLSETQPTYLFLPA